MTLKTVLVIVHDFPPAGGAGVQRVLKFVKYLPEFGWRAVVISATAESYPVLDAGLLDDVPADTAVYRAASCNPNRLRPQFERLRLGKVLSAANAALLLPDAALTWAYRARAQAREAVAEHRPAVIFSSALPASAHLLGLWVSRSFRLPWVADFRDPWSENELQPYLPGYRALNRWLERQVLNAASRITTVSLPLAEMLGRLANAPNKVQVIENGYDEDDVVCLTPPQTSQFTITYTGEFSRIRRPDAFVAAVERLVTDGAIPLDDIRVCFAGKETAKFVPDKPPFEQLGYLSHDALNALRLESDLLLLIHGDSTASRGNYSGKIFEYLGCNRPTLVIAGPGNVAAELIMAAHAGVATAHDPDAIAEVLLDYYRRWKAGRFDYQPDWAIIQRFTRRNLTGRLANILDQLVTET